MIASHIYAFDLLVLLVLMFFSWSTLKAISSQSILTVSIGSTSILLPLPVMVSKAITGIFPRLCLQDTIL